jgi:hypothetical protein
MGYGEDQPPAIRADSVPNTLQHPAGFQMLFLTFIAWDYIRLSWSADDGSSGTRTISSGRTSTDYFFEPVVSSAIYTFVAQGCYTNDYCSPASPKLSAKAPHLLFSFRTFLKISGVNLQNDVSLVALVNNGGAQISLRDVMRLGE